MTKQEREAFEAMREALRQAIRDPDMVSATWRQIRAALALADAISGDVAATKGE